jgi:hypothetical protein
MTWFVTIVAVLGICIGWIFVDQMIRRFRCRRILRSRGIRPEQVKNCQSVTLILDHVYGASIGLGAPTVWLNDSISKANDDATLIVDSSKILLVSKTKRNIDALRELFPGARIVESTTI